MPSSRFFPFILATLTAFIGLTSAIWVDWSLALILATNAFFLTYLALGLGKVRYLNEGYLRKHAAASDAPVLVIFGVTLLAMCLAVVSLFLVVDSHGTPAWRLVLALLAVPLGWATIHLMAAVHYAHLFWQPGLGQGQPRKGLEFPGTPKPDGWDFVYFAYVIGMAAQTSDVAISEPHIRRFATIHSIAAFFFNTVLVASAVNVAVTLGN